MSLFWIIILLILVWIATPIIKVWRKVRKFQNDYMRNAQQQGSTGQRQSYSTEPQEEEMSMADRYRKYSDSMAENVEFEELEGPMQEPQKPSPDNGPTTRYQQEAVSDAEFEEI